jgi:hypothetical protein
MRALRRSLWVLLLLLALPSGAVAGAFIAEGDLISKAPSGETDMSPSLLPVIDPLGGLADVGLDGDFKLFGAANPADGGIPAPRALTDAGAQLESTPMTFVGPDGTITAVWSHDGNSGQPDQTEFARLAPGATNWVMGPAITGDVGPRGATRLPDGTIEEIGWDDSATPVTLSTRTLAPHGTAWSGPVTLHTLPSSDSIDDEGLPELVSSPSGVVAAAWTERTVGSQHNDYNEIGGALQAVDGSWPAAAQDLLGDQTNQVYLGALALPDSGRSARLILNQQFSTAPELRVVSEQLTDDGPVPMTGVPAAAQGDGSFYAEAATFDATGVLQIMGATETGIDESDVPTTHNGQLPGAPYLVVNDTTDFGETISLARLPTGRLLLSYSGTSSTSDSLPVDLITRDPGGSWSAPQQLLGPLTDTTVRLGGIATDAGGDAYVTWSRLDHDKAALSGEILDNTPPVIDGLTLAPATAGQSAQFGVTAHDSWSATSASWNFGDGTSTTGTAPTHTYTSSGVQTVGVTVTDAAHNTTSTQTTLTVAQAPTTSSAISTPSLTTTTGAPTTTAPQATTTTAAQTTTPPAPRDRTAPRLSLVRPACAKHLTRKRCQTFQASAASWHTLRGTVSDTGGVSAVTVTATSGQGRRCRVLNPQGRAIRAACAKAAKLHARVVDGRWSVAAPGLAAGTWHLVILATDRSHNIRRLAVTLRLSATGH